MSRILFVIVFCAILGVLNKEISYFQNVAPNDSSPASVETPNYLEYALQAGEILNLEDPRFTEIFKSNNEGRAAQGQFAKGAVDLNYLTGFVIDEQRGLDIPLFHLIIPSDQRYLASSLTKKLGGVSETEFQTVAAYGQSYHKYC
jgi:hypothetical protein